MAILIKCEQLTSCDKLSKSLILLMAKARLNANELARRTGIQVHKNLK